MFINEFCNLFKNHSKPTKIFYHGTSLVLQKTINDMIMTPTSIDIGNAFIKPGRSIFMWKTEEEAFKWAVGDLLIFFDEWLNSIKENGKINTETTACNIFVPDNALIDTEKFRIRPWWDRIKNCWIIPEREEANFKRVLAYFEKYKIGTYVLKLETHTKYVSIGQTSTLHEYTTRDPETKIIDYTHYRVRGKDIIFACEIVSDSYFEESDAIGDAALMNRGILSFFNTNEFDINARYNEELCKFRSKFNFSPNINVEEYMRDNDIKIIKMYPIERIYRTIRGKKYLKDKYGV